MRDEVTYRRDGQLIKSTVHDLMTDLFDMHYEVFYRKSGASSLLNSLCDRHGSDKGEVATSGHPYPWPSHSYADFIERLFGHCRHTVQAVFECGLGTADPSIPGNMSRGGRPGASLRVWRDYFVNATIIGADIDRSILFQEDRIATYWCDQTDPNAIAQLWSQVAIPLFDLMIDDGLHTFEAGICLFEHSFHKLREGGIYVIEDVDMPRLTAFIQYFRTKPYRCDFVTLRRQSLPMGDNALVVIRK